MNQNLASLLTQSLSPIQMELLRLLADEAAVLGFPLYLVGGLVRDLLLGYDNNDIDLVVEGDAPAFARILADKYGGKVTVHPRFRTAKWDIRGSRIGNGNLNSNINSPSMVPDFIDLVSARSETYKIPASLPSVKMGRISDDLRRRDLTINALAVRLDGPYFGELRDDFGGADDLRNGLIRVLYERSFIDDPTRIFRAIRYEQRLGFKVADETLVLIPEALGLIKELSPHRIRHELDLILEEPGKALILARLSELDLLTQIHGSLPWDEAVRLRFNVNRQPELLDGKEDERVSSWLRWLMTLSVKQIESLNKRLHFTTLILKALLAASRLYLDLNMFLGWKPSECVEYLDEMPLLSVYTVYLCAPEGKPKLSLGKYLETWRYEQPKITGKDLKKRGLPSGPIYNQVLRKLRNAWLDQEVVEPDGEKKLLDEILRKL